MRIVFTLILVLSMVGVAVAHDMFLMPERFRTVSGETLTLGIHSGDGFPDSTQLPLRLTDALMHAGGKATPMQDVRNEEKRAVANLTVTGSGHILATVISAPTTIEMRANSFVSYLKEEGLTDIIDARVKAGETEKAARERYGKYAKAILLSGAPNDGYKALAGLPIEFVPQLDPYRLKVGDTLPVRLLFRGAPAAGLEVKAASTAPGSKPEVIGKTDANGMISVKLTSAGPWRLHAILMQRSPDATADWESFWSTLTFEIP